MHVEAIAFHQALASASRNTNDMGLRLIRVQREMATLLKGRSLRDARRDSSLLRHLILAVGGKVDQVVSERFNRATYTQGIVKN